jgi:hypothetical protein
MASAKQQKHCNLTSAHDEIQAAAKCEHRRNQARRDGATASPMAHIKQLNQHSAASDTILYH